VGYWPDRDTIARQWQVGQTFIPHSTEQQRAQKLEHWHKALSRARNWEPSSSQRAER
jgi:glycerol kinase